MDKKNFALITGASAGIGEACALGLARKGKNLVLVARRAEKLEDMKKRLEDEYEIEVKVFALDVCDFEALEKMFGDLAGVTIDVLINNAGLALGKASFEDYDWKDFERMIDVNVKAFTRVAQLAIPRIKEAQGHIVNISSVAGIEGYEGGSVYCATKSYVKMLSHNMRVDLAGTGVRVTDIAPGAVDTEFSTVRFKGDKEKAGSVYEGYVPLYAEDIAETILFALSRPPAVNIEYMLVMPTAQASACRVAKD